MSTISYDNWKSSAEKWIDITRRSKLGSKNNPREWLFYVHVVIKTPCGYCEEFLRESAAIVGHCSNCPAYQEKICSYLDNKDTRFWKLINLSEITPKDWQGVYQEAKVIHDWVLHDCPDKAQALMDGIDIDALLAENPD